jgi:hypothetical protein
MTDAETVATLEKLWAQERRHTTMLDLELRRMEAANVELRVQNRELKDRIIALAAGKARASS